MSERKVYDVPRFTGAITSHSPQTALYVIAQCIARLAMDTGMFDELLDSVVHSHEDADKVRERPDRHFNLMTIK